MLSLALEAATRLMNGVLALVDDPHLAVMALTATAAIATVLTLGMPLLAGDNLTRRMDAVAVQRAKIRARERERVQRGESVQLRQTPKAYMKRLVDALDLRRWLGSEDAGLKLMRAGYRSPSAMVTLLFFRAVTPVVLLAAVSFYVFVIWQTTYPMAVRAGLCIVAAYLGIKLPEIVLRNVTQKRQLSIRRAWPDAMDLLLICVESGMSIEHAFRKVGQEVSTASLPLAEEMGLTTAELAYLPDRRQAYENLANRTDLEGVKGVTTALIQAERYGTPIGQALRVLAQENRDMRMMEAEKKAAALPPMLTVPMILFFLPVLFVVILGPALIQVFHWT